MCVQWLKIVKKTFSRTLLFKEEQRNCGLIPKTPDYQLGWAVLSVSRLLDTLKRNTYYARTGPSVLGPSDAWLMR